MTPRLQSQLSRHGAAAVVWLLAWVAMFALDGRLDLANLAMLLVLAAALGGLWWPPAVSAPACLLSVLAFNWFFVPPRGTFTVDLHQHALLLATMLAVAWIVAALVARQRALAQRAQAAARQAQELRAMGDALRDADDPASSAEALRQALSALAGAPAAMLLLRRSLPMRDDDAAAEWHGTVDANQRAGLWLCVRQSSALGPGTGRHEDQPDWYLPLRGRGASQGAVQMRSPGIDDERFAHAQALCDQFGLALERAQALAQAAAAREEARTQQMRNTLLAAVAHDLRTPLATLLGAATSLVEQDARLAREQRVRLASAIVGEAEHLSRIVENTLQLARLDTPGITLALDWESAEEMVGTVLARERARDPHHRLRSRVEPGLPLVRCDAVLVVQMLSNLVHNALAYSGDDAPVEILVRRVGAEMMFAVRDRGPGIAPGLRERIFEVYQRGEASAGGRHGAGVGLALCRAVARVHGGRLALRARHHGGSSFECFLPLGEAPGVPEASS
jgi:two-component system sensor histidine kinase KdpD